MKEISELQVVDFEVGKYIAGAYHNLAVSGPVSFQSFLNRADNKKIFRSDNETPQSFMQRFRKYKTDETVADSGDVIAAPELPLIHYYRKPGMSNSGADDYKVHYESEYRYIADFAKQIDIAVLPVVLTYQMRFIAFDKLTIDKLSLWWWSWINRHYRMPINYKILDEPLTVFLTLEERKTLSFDDDSVDYQEGGRLWCVNTELQFHTNVIIGEGVSFPDEYQVDLIMCDFCMDIDEGCTG